MTFILSCHTAEDDWVLKVKGSQKEEGEGNARGQRSEGGNETKREEDGKK